jgi:hypothetical protein
MESFELRFAETVVPGFAARALSPGTLSLTLTTFFGLCLLEAESLFGPRDPSWTPVGVEFREGRAQIIFPWEGLGGRLISIALPLESKDDLKIAAFHLAHETVHVLAPLRFGDAPVIEEGLATTFATHISHKFQLNRSYTDRDYLEAARLVDYLLNIDVAAIQKLRRRAPSFADFTPDLILSEVPTLPRQTAETLCQPFTSLQHLRTL